MQNVMHLHYLVNGDTEKVGVLDLSDLTTPYNSHLIFPRKQHFLSTQDHCKQRFSSGKLDFDRRPLPHNEKTEGAGLNVNWMNL